MTQLREFADSPHFKTLLGERNAKLKPAYQKKLNIMSSDELLKQLDMMIMARIFHGKEKTEFVQKAIVRTIFKKFPETAKAEGFRKKFIEN